MQEATLDAGGLVRWRKCQADVIFRPILASGSQPQRWGSHTINMDSPTPPPNQLSLDELAQRCAEETQRYLHQDGSTDRYCLELMRQALFERLSEAFTHIYRVYERLVLHWVYRHPAFEQTGEAAEYFVSQAFSNFYFATRGEKFQQFGSLAQLLTYLKRCVHTSIAQYVRDTAAPPQVDLSETLPSSLTSVEQFVILADIWERIQSLLPAASDQLLVQAVFSQGLKPADMVALHPGHWSDARAVSVDLQRIRRALRKDVELRRLLGAESGSGV